MPAADSANTDGTPTCGDWRRCVDLVPSLLAYWDIQLLCRFANRAHRVWLGVEPEQLLGKHLRDVLGPEEHAMHDPHIVQAMNGQPQAFERILRLRDGTRRNGWVSYTPDVVDGHVAGLVSQFTDVTSIKAQEQRRGAMIRALEVDRQARRSMREASHDAQQTLAVTLATVDCGVIATDRHGHVLRMNQVGERLTGWAQAQAIGRAVREVFQHDDVSAVPIGLDPADWRQGREAFPDNARSMVVVSRQGVRTPVQVRSALTHASDGTVQGLVLVLHDLTKTLLSEVDSNRLAAIVESSQDGIIGKTLDGRITSWNAAAQSIFGYSAAEAVGQPVQMLIPLERQHEEMAILAKLARGVRVPPFETVRVAKDGHLIDVSISISPIRDAQGRIAGASKIVRDVTQLKHVERLEAENREIQAASRLKSQFLANMSHELRTPLNAIIGFAELLHSGAVRPDSVKQHVFLGHIAHSGRHLLRLINDVLDLAKVESGQFEFFPERIDLSTLVREASDILRTSIERKQLRCSLEVDPQLDHIVLDPGRLKQLLYNYLSNAIKFTPEQGCITVRARASGEQHFVIEVEDDGIGIAAEQVARLFTEFHQLDGGYGKRHEGTGLGLALTRRLVEAQGGSVGVRSEPGRGSVFHARLNRVHGTDAVAATVDGRGLRMLVIEADRVAQARLIRTLSDAGFVVDVASDARQARLLSVNQGFDALTLDLRLPDQSGLGLLASLREHGLSRKVPVVGMTLSTATGALASFAISDILCKPIRSEEIIAAMGRFKHAANASVMVIDDDPLALDLMHTMLMTMGIQAACHQDGRVALGEIDLHQPLAIILDLMMPEFDGFAFLDALRRLPRWRDTPVFVWTSMALTDEEHARLASSAQAVLGKGGGDLDAMLEQLRRWRPAAAGPP